MSDRVTISIDGGVADVRLNRADKMNAFDPAMFAAVVEAGERLKTEPGVRAVVLSGEGRAFCSGLDFSQFQAMAGRGGEDRAAADDGPRLGRIFDLDGRITHLGQQAAWVWQELPMPVIVAVHGVAFGAGIQLALGADIRFVAPDAQLSVLEIRWGLTPDMTATVTLSRLLPLDVAKELVFTGRIVSGEEAGKLGLATHVTPTPLDDALALARQIAGKNPHAVRGAKQLLNQARDASVADQFAAERDTISGLISSPNQVEAIKAYFEKRDPVFTD